MSSEVPLRLREFALFAASLIPVATLNAQCVTVQASAGQPYTLQAGTQAVFVDVVATDKNKRARTDLTVGSFHLSEDGVVQVPKSFSLHAADSAGSRAQVEATHKNSLGNFSNFHQSQHGQSINILLLDTLNTALADQQRARRQVASVLASLPLGQPIALFTLGARLQMIQDFTEEPDTLIAAASQIKSHASPLYLEHGPTNSERMIRYPGLT
jgi:VWFA-related protein